MDAALLSRIADAYQALAHGEVDPLVALLDEDVEWHGVPWGEIRR
jgi:ketosteroid isomerase-like protein